MTGGEMPRVSIVVPAYNEGDQIVPVLDRLFESVHLQCEVLVVVDDEADTTVPVVTEYALKEPRIRCLVNTYGSGPANAIRFGTDAAAAAVTVVTMADGCDDPRQIDDLARLVDRGVAIAAASRYMPGGQQVGGPLMKGFLSKTAGRSLRLLAHTGTRDATNSFKAYSTSFLRQVGIDSRHGFEIGIEHRQGEADGPAGRRDPHDLAGQASRNVQLQDGGLDSEVPALVPVRVRAEADRRSDPVPWRGDQEETVTG